MSDVPAAEVLRKAFWADGGPALPSGAKLTRLEPFVVSQPGPGGSLVLDRARLATTAGGVDLLIAYRAKLTPRDVPRLTDRLRSICDELRARGMDLHKPSVERTIAAVAIESATPRIINAAIAGELALFDTRGTVVVRSPQIFVHVEGRGTARRAKTRTSPFTGKAVRIVRQLLVRANAGIDGPRSIQVIASATHTSYSYARGVLTTLETEGFVARATPRSGFRLRDPVGLLQAWIGAGTRTARAVKGFHAPSTTVDALRRARELCLASAGGNPPVWSLASGLRSDEVFVSGLPHGAYFVGDPHPLIDALELRDVTPHNFLLLIADPEDETIAGGLLEGTRDDLDHGSAVALPQLIIDFHTMGGRGPEQARFLIDRFAASVPFGRRYG